MTGLTIVTSCSGYGHFVPAWAESIAMLYTKPDQVCIFTHGLVKDADRASDAVKLLQLVGVSARHEHSGAKLDFGTARNRAVEMSTTEWVMHLDCDDQIMPHAVDDFLQIAPDADVVQFGYVRAGDKTNRPTNERRIYQRGDGLEMLTHISPASGVSPFRRSLWERSPYRTDMKGAWDTALWIGFARLGARFRPTQRPCFWYWHHIDSVFTKRRMTFDWTHSEVINHLKSLRRNDRGVAIIVPRDDNPAPERAHAWKVVSQHLQQNHPGWPIVEGESFTEEWRKGDAIAFALKKLPSTEVLVIADADCVVAPDALRDAVFMVQRGHAPWAIPHKMVYRLTPEATTVWSDAILSPQAWASPFENQCMRKPYVGYAGGGMFVVRRRHYEAVGGIPRAFQGWGCEDEAIALILNTMVGEHWRGDADLLHLWHEPQPTKRTPESNRKRLRELRLAAKNGPADLWKVLQTLPDSVLRHPGLPLAPRQPKKPVRHGVGISARQTYLATRGNQ